MQAAQVKRRALAGLPQEGSFECVARRWFAVKENQWMETCSSKVIRRLELHAFPKFGRKLLPEISPKIVLDACREVEARDTLETAHRLREHCSSVFRFAIAEGADLRDPCSEIRDALKRPPVRHFAAITKPAELTGLLRAIDNYSGTLCVRSALKLSPMLMVRPGGLDDIVTAATTNSNATEKTIDRATIMKTENETKISSLGEQVLKLKSAEDEL